MMMRKHTPRTAAAKRRQREGLAEKLSRDRQRQAAERLDDAEAIVGPIRRPDGKPADPEAVLGEAAKRLRRHAKEHNDPWARDLADECEELADDELADD
jgi:hypothetical protein